MSSHREVSIRILLNVSVQFNTSMSFCRDRGQLTSGDGAYNHQTISSQVSPAVSRTEVTVPASNSMQTVVSTPSEPVGPSVTTSTPQGQEQDAVASSGVQTQGRTC